MSTTTDSPTETPISERVVDEVAAATDSDPIDLEPLYTRVDPDALDALFSNGAGTTVRHQGEITFPMAGCDVTVGADGTVEVDPQTSAQNAFETAGIETPTSAVESPD